MCACVHWYKILYMCAFYFRKPYAVDVKKHEFKYHYSQRILHPREKGGKITKQTFSLSVAVVMVTPGHFVAPPLFGWSYICVLAFQAMYFPNFMCWNLNKNIFSPSLQFVISCLQDTIK